ncbi:MAG: homoserine dehydrogenase MetL [Oceanicaulis sp. HLUCCA04]|nr:MAG: homoserine dehydrogenase MetL [Oceanicaulis sp. HLUCCA04]
MAPLDNASTYLSQTVVRSRPMRAVLLGCGTVGGTLATRLPQGVALEAIALQRWRAVATPLGRPAVRVLDDLDAALDLGPELVIDALPGCEAAERALERAVLAGAHVVSANKAVIARRPDLERAARAKGRAFLYSAAVGGGVPVLETVHALIARGREITTVKGVFNGTSNFVLDRLSRGETLDTAVRAAQEAGFAEADPGADLDGDDAAAKLVLTARTAWGVDIDPGSIARQSIRNLAPGFAAKAAREGLRIRQIGRLARSGGGVHAAVRLEAVSADSVFYRVEREGNGVVIALKDAPGVILTGKGAGGVPTAASMAADIARLLAEHG